jgi:hypothetical protein
MNLPSKINAMEVMEGAKKVDPATFKGEIEF